ncbi:MAG: hypothetical protein WC763_05060 [Candidatus Paceibacterota bacterium]
MEKIIRIGEVGLYLLRAEFVQYPFYEYLQKQKIPSSVPMNAAGTKKEKTKVFQKPLV